ncbi:hypothetical protein PspLS_00264 [Pyricularia sp. CBS 133598]|nr:hypothetical protein PspLS_00264 [Pyricularia sp. CBS 133598]
MPENKPETCSSCSGTGQVTCLRCGGSRSDMFVECAICLHCDATGQVQCAACDGKGEKTN